MCARACMGHSRLVGKGEPNPTLAADLVKDPHWRVAPTRPPHGWERRRDRKRRWKTWKWRRRRGTPVLVAQQPQRIGAVLRHDAHDCVVKHHIPAGHDAHENVADVAGAVAIHVAGIAVARVVRKPRSEAGAPARAVPHLEAALHDALLIGCGLAPVEHHRLLRGDAFGVPGVHPAVLQPLQRDDLHAAGPAWLDRPLEVLRHCLVLLPGR
mmetsp:Transcript_50427/g.158767  ORF Transcript_50427/g.158767 Transcript_50427/m.158767 type:complete len:211 (-) Transcript_50427:971-1603(-)